MKLVSEDLRERFAEIYLEIFEQDATRRVSALRRASDSAVLTYAIVTFDPRGVAALGTTHDTIVSGGSMGEVIKRSGVEHTRSVSEPVASPIPEHVKALFDTTQRKCRAEIITYEIRGEPYAQIQGLYNPEFTPVPPREKASLAR